MASEVLMTISRDEVERARLMSEYKYELDTQSRIVYAWQQGEKEGGRYQGTTEGGHALFKQRKKRRLTQIRPPWAGLPRKPAFSPVASLLFLLQLLIPHS
jgi:hypothetical protein